MKNIHFQLIYVRIWKNYQNYKLHKCFILRIKFCIFLINYLKIKFMKNIFIKSFFAIFLFFLTQPLICFNFFQNVKKYYMKHLSTCSSLYSKKCIFSFIPISFSLSYFLCPKKYKPLAFKTSTIFSTILTIGFLIIKKKQNQTS